MQLRPILIVSSSLATCQTLESFLRAEHYSTRFALSAQEALFLVSKAPPLFVLLDTQLNKESGVSVLMRIKACYPETPIVLLTDNKNPNITFDALKKGGCDFIEKPIHKDHLLLCVRTFLKHAQTNLENQFLKSYVRDTIFLSLPSLPTHTFEKCYKGLLSSKDPLFIQGEAGVGKESLALWIHHTTLHTQSGCIKALDAHTIQPQTVDELFFGREESQFGLTKPGLLDQTFGGTLLIREAQNLAPEVQKKLANLIHKRTFKRLNGDELPLETRIILTSAYSFDVLKEQAFSQTLLDRLKNHTIDLKPLRERKNDIEILAKHQLKILSDQYHKPLHEISSISLSRMREYSWPGNIDELRNMIERSLILSQQPSNVPLVCHFDDDLKKTHRLNTVTSDYLNHALKSARALFEKRYLATQLERFNFNIQRTAFFIGMERSALHRKLRMLGLEKDQKKERKLAS